MKKREVFIISLFTLSNLLSANQVKVKLEVLAVYRIQTITTSVNMGDRIVGYTKGGDVTASFPSGILLIPTEFGPDTDSSLILQLLRDEVFKNSCIPVNAKRLGNYEFIIAGEEKEIKEELRDFAFNLIITPLNQLEDRAVLTIVFRLKELKWEEYKELLNKTIGIKYSKYFLIGFPSYSEGPRGTIFWLSFLLEKQ